MLCPCKMELELYISQTVHHHHKETHKMEVRKKGYLPVKIITLPKNCCFKLLYCNQALLVWVSDKICRPVDIFGCLQSHKSSLHATKDKDTFYRVFISPTVPTSQKTPTSQHHHMCCPPAL